MFLVIIFGISVTTLILIYHELTKNYDYWQKRGVPYEKPTFFFGNLKESVFGREHFSETLTRLYKKFPTSPYFGIYVCQKPALVVKDPEVIKRVLVKDFDKFTNYAGPEKHSKSDTLVANSLIGVKDDVWKNLRAKLTPIFTSGKLKLMFPLMKTCCEDFELYLGKYNSKVVDIRGACKKLSVDIISSCAFGMNTNCLQLEEPPEIFEMSSRLLDFTNLTRVFSVFTYFFLPKLFSLFKLNFADKKASDYLMNVFIANYHERIKQNVVRHDLIDHLHNLKKTEFADDKYKFDDFRMASQAIAFFFGGNDTTSIATTYALYEVALNTEIGDRLREEIRKYDEITYETVQSMKYLDMVLAESQRRRPTGTAVNRVCGAPYYFKETGFTLDKGINILVPFGPLHNDAAYFPEPEKFDPERFSDENKHTIKPCSFIPFGEGPRSCIAQRFALMVVKLSIIYAVKNYRFHVCDETLIPLELEKGSVLFVQPKDNKLFLRVEKI